VQNTSKHASNLEQDNTVS